MEQVWRCWVRNCTNNTSPEDELPICFLNEPLTCFTGGPVVKGVNFVNLGPEQNIVVDTSWTHYPCVQKLKQEMSLFWLKPLWPGNPHLLKATIFTQPNLNQLFLMPNIH